MKEKEGMLKRTLTTNRKTMKRFKFQRAGRNVTFGPNKEWHMFDFGSYILILKGGDVNRIQMPEGVDVNEYKINSKKVYSDLTAAEVKNILK